MTTAFTTSLTRATRSKHAPTTSRADTSPARTIRASSTASRKQSSSSPIPAALPELTFPTPTTADFEGDRTWFAPEEVRLVVEVVSPESAHRDRTVKLRKYAEAGIPHYWCVEDEDGAPVVHVYELDEPTGAYAPAGIFRHTRQRELPFEIGLDLDKLTPSRER
ncbi:Uma2 family endonuclease [Streptomyces spectabilis]|uniref:Uma2 family endonuclease n=1 Tax=Streptomyces spectabilis TaxID=68270 RepID=UPI0034050A71